MGRLVTLLDRLAAGLGPALVLAGSAALVVLVVNRMPCVEVEGFEEGPWPAEGWVAAAESGGTLQPSSAHDGSMGSQDVPWHYRTDLSVAVRTRLGAWVRADRAGAGRFYLGFDATAAGCKSLVLAFNTDDIRFHDNPGFGYTELNETDVQVGTGRWYFLEVEVEPEGRAMGRLYEADGTTLVATVTQTFPDGIGSGGIAMRSFGGVSVDTITFCP
jgi:hypothetical protein